MIGAGVLACHPLPDGAAARFDAFHARLKEANARMDLTAVVDDGEALHKHYLDSLTALSLIPHGAALVDIGTGAGFPGMPIALARPDVAVCFLDALKKRVSFLQDTIVALRLEAEAVHMRAEDFARVRPDGFDVAASRAVAALPVLLEWALPLVRPGGRCILWKGPGVTDELEAARHVSPLLGGGPPTVVEAPVPGLKSHHVLVVVEKEKPTPQGFPRKAGMAFKRPL